jgi:hypothetical protein
VTTHAAAPENVSMASFSGKKTPMHRNAAHVRCGVTLHASARRHAPQ